MDEKDVRELTIEERVKRLEEIIEWHLGSLDIQELRAYQALINGHLKYVNKLNRALINKMTEQQEKYSKRLNDNIDKE